MIPERTERGSTRIALAACAALGAVAASVVVAIGPARGESAQYSWPPASLPSATPTRGWYGPLPLLNRVPESITLELPCGLSPPLAGRPATVIATARHPERIDGFEIAVADRALDFKVGRSTVAEVPWPAACPLNVEVRDGQLHLPGRTVALTPGTLDEMPIVTGLFTEVDLQTGRPPRVGITTRDYATSSTVRQDVAAALAVALAALALFLLLRHEIGRRSTRIRGLLKRAWEARTPTDAVVCAVLLIWWIISPTFADDGWFWAEYRAIREIGADSFLFDYWAVTRPVGSWIAWLEQWSLGTSNLLVARLPTLGLLLATWLLCRLCLTIVLGVRPTAAARWVLSAGFLVGAAAWGITLRPEPIVTLLALVSLTAMVAFRREPRATPLAVAAIATVLALTAHPTGIVALAPLLAAAPHVARALRRDSSLLRSGVVLAGVALAVMLLLFTFGADLEQRLDDSTIVRSAEAQGGSFWNEHLRYTLFDVNGGGTPLRHLSVALMFACAIAAVTRRRSVATGVTSIPGWSVGIGLALLAFVPSKWPWHFAVLFPIAAVAIAAEVVQVSRERAKSPRSLRGILALVVLGGVAFMAWSAPGFGSPLELQELTYRSGFNAASWLVCLLALPAAAVLTARTLARRRGRQTYDLIPALLPWTVVSILLGALAISTALLIADAVKSPWSPARHNLEVLTGRSSGCGLAEEFTNAHSLEARMADASNTTLVHPTVGAYFGCETAPRIAEGLAEIPDTVIFNDGAWPLYMNDSPFAAPLDLYSFRLIGRGPEIIKAYAIHRQIPGYVTTAAVRSAPSGP